MWETRAIERMLETMLIGAPHGASKGRELNGRYEATRRKIVTDVVPNIPGAAPSLTDHGPRHVADVLDRAYRLLGEDVGFSDGAMLLSPLELYALCLCIVFHDVGNVYGRESHERNIQRVYDWALGNDANPSEKKAVLLIAGAHAGTTSSGSRDTLAEVPSELTMHGGRLRALELAAVLRFADELAEGAHRTSGFMQAAGLYANESAIHHAYAAVTEVHIDRGTQRIGLIYDLKISKQHPTQSVDEQVEALRSLLDYIVQRIRKLDHERQYARYYAPVLAPFRVTEATFNFWVDGALADLDFGPLQLEDHKVVPGELPHAKQVVLGADASALDELCRRIKTESLEAPRA